MFTLKHLLVLDQNPAPYETGDEFWNDPYISGQLLPFHLNPDTDPGQLQTPKPWTPSAPGCPKPWGLCPARR